MFRAMDFTSSSRALLAALLCLLVPYVVWYQTKLRRAHSAKKNGTLDAPIASGMSLILDSLNARKAHRLLEFSSKRFQALGSNTVHLVFPGGHFHETAQPENVKAMLSTDFKTWGLESSRKSNFRPAIGDGIFIAEGVRWQHSRTLLRPMFARSQLGDFEIFENQASHLIEAIVRGGGKINLKDLFFRLTLDTSLEFLVGESTSSLTNDSDTNESLNAALHRVEHHIQSGGSLGGTFGFLFAANRRFAQDIQIIQAFVDSYIHQRLAQRPQLLHRASSHKEDNERLLFLDELVKQTADPIRIRDEILSVLFAGRDTTASMLTNIFFVLSKRPDVWAALQAEIARVLPKGGGDGHQRPTFDQLKRLKYLRAIINESLRLHPVVPGNMRQAVVDTTLPSGGGPGGKAPIFIPAGDVVMFNTFCMQRRTDLYGKNALEFIPERWLDTEGEKGLRVSWEYIPFGGGPRICLGQQFALNHAMYTIVRMCQVFSKIESWDEEEVWKESITLGICTNLGGAKVVLMK